jgi:hypothetical protein
MFCPRCGARSEVRETRGPFRDRRCTNAVCRLSFTTRELIMKERKRIRLCAKTRATHLEPLPPSPAPGDEAGSTLCPALCAPPDPGKGASGIQGEQKCKQAGAAG